MPSLPWQAVGEPEPAAECLVFSSRFELSRYRSVLSFVRLVGAIRKQLAETDGLIGYSLATQLPSKTFFTLSAWRDQDALDAFVRTSPHRETVAKLRPLMARSVFESWPVPGESLPVTWPEAKKRLATAAEGPDGQPA